MPRHSTLRKKKVGNTSYWFTKCGGDTYFGNVKNVSHAEAKKLFGQHVANVNEARENSKGRTLSAGMLMDVFLDWIKKHRSERTYSSRRNHCNRFASFSVHGIRIAEAPALKIRSADLETCLDRLEAEGLSAQTRRHFQTSIKHCWNWGTKHTSPTGNTPYLPTHFRPFSSVERVYVAPKTLTEADLISDEEIRSLFAAAEIDLDNFHRFGPKTPRSHEDNPYRSFADMLRCYYATGARTDELAQCRVGDVLPRTKQVILGKHKRSKTQRIPSIRHITLNLAAMRIFDTHCQGKRSEEWVFRNSDNKPFTRKTVAERFKRVREIANSTGLGKVRDGITIYSFRDLWISEALMAGNDITTIARMAGTSGSMIERVYGHFRNQHLHDAQDRVDRLRQHRGR